MLNIFGGDRYRQVFAVQVLGLGFESQHLHHLQKKVTKLEEIICLFRSRDYFIALIIVTSKYYMLQVRLQVSTYLLHIRGYKIMRLSRKANKK